MLQRQKVITTMRKMIAKKVKETCKMQTPNTNQKLKTSKPQP
jgi:hypothetical protein